MLKIDNAFRVGIPCLTACLGLLFGASDAAGQCCGTIPNTAQTYKVQYGTRVEPCEVTTYKKVFETEMREEQVVSYKTEWETQERRTTVARQVPETSVYQEAYKVLKPVWNTEYRDESYNVTRYVQETSEREERVVVSKPVIEMEQREIVETVRKPVVQTVMQEKRYVVNRPSTTFETKVVDRGQYVDTVNVQPGQTYNRLAWQRGGCVYDPATGASRRQLPGLYWTPMTTEAKYNVQKVYKPNLVAEQFPVTTMVPETVVEQVPVNITTYQEEKVLKVQPVRVQKMVQEEIVKKIPVTTYKPVVERIEKIVPVQVCKMQEEEVVRDVPRTTYKTVLEEKVQEVKVPRRVREVRVVQKPVVVERLVPLTSTISSSKTIVKRIPIPDPGPYPAPEEMIQKVEKKETPVRETIETIETDNGSKLPPVHKEDNTST